LNFKKIKEEYRNFDKSLNLNWTQKEGKGCIKNMIVKKDGFVEVIENKGKIIGYLYGRVTEGYFFCKKAKYAELESILVKEKFRGKNLGIKLVKDFISWCKKNKVKHIIVEPYTRDKGVLKFYKKAGFKNYSMVLKIETNKKNKSICL
jgi:GNAT superfamily N-acetyltransferase